MKKSELLDLFREYFNDELKQIVKEVVTQELKEHSKKSSSFVNNKSSSLSELMEDIELIGTREKKQPIKKKIELFKSKNPLSQLLNETAEEAMAQQYEEEDDGEMPVFDRRLFTSKSVLEKERMNKNNDNTETYTELTKEEINTKKQLRDKYMGVVGESMSFNTPGGGGVSSAQEMIPEDRKGVIIPAELESALTKDYTQLVKKFKK